MVRLNRVLAGYLAFVGGFVNSVGFVLIGNFTSHVTGNIGRPGTGANSITGQCNAMGSRLFGNATSLLGGYDFANVIAAYEGAMSFTPTDDLMAASMQRWGGERPRLVRS